MAESVAPVVSVPSAAGLRRHVPELALEWLLECPEQRWRLIDGTLCFADISGFTALAERLARLGRIGGEELVETLGSVFGRMLGIANRRGGTLLKFGGDALLLIFRGNDHALQAAAAAVEMRSALREAARQPTSVGPLRLSMSIGLHSGPVHGFLVGSAHRELVLLGPAVNAVIETENAAAAGEILVSADTAALLPATAVAARTDGRLRLRWRRAALPAAGHPALPVVDDTRVRELFPAALGVHLATAVPEPEHRVACIAFVRFSGTDAMLAGPGAEALARALDALFGAIQDCLAAEHVTLLAADIDHDGGKLFLGAGVPHAQEDPDGSMLRALRRISGLALPLPLQCGVNRGHVFVAEIGAAGRAAYSAMGDTTNTAARIAGKATPGTILAHPLVLDASLTVFDSRPAAPLLLKGKATPLVVYEVGAKAGDRRREHLSIDAFVGRAGELGVLAAALQALAAGTGGVLCVTGEPGLGKSRLLRHALARHAAESCAAPLLDLRGEPYGVNSHYRVFRDSLRALLGITAADPQALCAELTRRVTERAPELLPQLALLGDLMTIAVPESVEVQAIDSRFRAERAAAALSRLLAIVNPGPAIVCIDDAQWCDAASAQILDHLARSTATHPWLLLVARRLTAGGFVPQGGQTLALEPLPGAAIAELVQLASEAAPLRPHEVDLIVQRADGNPMFAAEILRIARTAGSLDAVPESLEAAMTAQVDALDFAARRLLRYASVLGRSFSRPLMAEIVCDGDPQRADAALQRLAAFLEPDGASRIRFRNGVLRDVIYQGLAYRTRRQLHQSVAETMERLADDAAGVADSLALHYARANDAPQAWRHARIAGDRARDAYANADAARFYEIALDAARRVPAVAAVDLVPVWTRLGEVRERAGLLEASLDAYRRALQRVGDDRIARAELLADRASAKERMRAFPAALHDLSVGLRLLEGQDSQRAGAVRARLKNSIAWIRYGQDRPARALAHAREAAADARAANARAVLGGALVVTELARLMLEGPGDGGDLKEALAIFEQLGDLRMQANVAANLGFVCAYAGRWNEGVTWLTSAREQFLRIGDVVRAADPALNLGEMLVKQRRFDEAEPVLADAVRVLRAAHFAEGVNRAEIQLAWILLERGRFADAEATLQRVQQEFAAAGQSLAALEAAVVRAAGRLREGVPADALQLLDAAEKAAGSDSGLLLPMVACVRAPTLAALGRNAEGERLVDAAIRVAQTQGLLYEQASLLQIRMDLLRRRGALPDPDDIVLLERILTGLGVSAASG